MKKLEELGISQTPWRVGDAIPYCEEHVVYSENHRHDDGSRHNKVVATCNQYFEERVADARLIAAAPDMYEALWDLLFGDNGTANCRRCKGAELGNCKTCHFGKARFALEKAAGEDVAK